MQYSKFQSVCAVLSVWACLAAVPAKAQFTCTTNSGAITITGYTGSGGNVVIPSAINGYPVTAVGYKAFCNESAITSVTIPNSVTNIGDYAFADCYGLTMTIPNGVISIGEAAFYECYGLTNVTIPNSASSIGAFAFEGCCLTSVTIGSSVTSIGVEAFVGCSLLTNISVNATNSYYASVGGVLFNETLTTLIEYPGGLAGIYRVPNSVTSIGNGAFAQCSGLTSVTIPNSVISIGDEAFSACNGMVSGLSNVVMGTSVATIGDAAFDECFYLENVTISDSVTSIGREAFHYCYSLTSVTIPNRVLSIGDYAFNTSGLTNLVVGDSVTSIGSYAFANCSSLKCAYFHGNAPAGSGGPDGSVFYGEIGTAYYLPGTTGWGATFGGWPTAQWYQPQPQILGTGNGLGVHGSQFNFTISWATNVTVVVEASANLKSWTPLITNTLVNGTNGFSDAKWTNYPRRFYRVRSQ